MLRILVKKQLAEIFKSYFYDAKKNRMRSKLAIAGWIVFFLLIMVGMLGGAFTALSLNMCWGLSQAGLGWMYFLLMGGIAVVFGTFGSVLNTYAGLYLLIGYRIGAVIYMAIWSILLAAIAFVLLRWLDTRGVEAFSSL